MLEEVHDAVRVENMTARESRASFCAELLRVADRAELVLVDTVEEASLLCAVSVKAGKALALFCDTLACVSAFFVSLLAEGDRRFIDVLGDRVASFDQNDLFLLLLITDLGDHKAERFWH